MPVFSAVGWMIKGKGKQLMVKTTGLTEDDFKKNRSGITAKVEGGFSKKNLNLSFIILNVSDSDLENLKRCKVYFRVNVDENNEDQNGGWTSYNDTFKTIDVDNKHYSFTFKKNQFSGLILDYIANCNKMVISFRNSNYYLCSSGGDPDFRVSIS